MGRVTVHCYSFHNCHEKEIAYLWHVRLSVSVKKQQGVAIGRILEDIAAGDFRHEHLTD